MWGRIASDQLRNQAKLRYSESQETTMCHTKGSLDELVRAGGTDGAGSTGFKSEDVIRGDNAEVKINRDNTEYDLVKFDNNGKGSGGGMDGQLVIAVAVLLVCCMVLPACLKALEKCLCLCSPEWWSMACCKSCKKFKLFHCCGRRKTHHHHDSEDFELDSVISTRSQRIEERERQRDRRRERRRERRDHHHRIQVVPEPYMEGLYPPVPNEDENLPPAIYKTVTYRYTPVPVSSATSDASLESGHPSTAPGAPPLPTIVEDTNQGRE